jgi:hypothetical protein
MIGCGRVTVRLFDDGHVGRVVWEEDFADVEEQDVDSLFALTFLSLFIAITKVASSNKSKGLHKKVRRMSDKG